MAETVEVTIANKTYKVQISGPPPPMMPLDDLEKALATNRNHIKKATEDIKANFKKEIVDRAPPKKLNYDSPTQLAIMAHLNINMLIPIINVKGGSAFFEKPETLPVETRINGMHNVAKKAAMMAATHQPFPVATFSFTLLLSIFVIFVLLVL